MLKSNRLMLSLTTIGLVIVTIVTMCMTMLFPSAAISRVTVSDGDSILSVGKRDYQFLSGNCTIDKATDGYTDLTTNISYGSGISGVGFVKNWREKSEAAVHPVVTGIFWDARGAHKGMNQISGDVFSINFPKGAWNRVDYYDVRVTISNVQFYLSADMPADSKLGTGFNRDLNGTTDDIWENRALLPILVDMPTLAVYSRSSQYPGDKLRRKS